MRAFAFIADDAITQMHEPAGFLSFTASFEQADKTATRVRSFLQDDFDFRLRQSISRRGSSRLICAAYIYHDIPPYASRLLMKALRTTAGVYFISSLPRLRRATIIVFQAFRALADIFARRAAYARFRAGRNAFNASPSTIASTPQWSRFFRPWLRLSFTTSIARHGELAALLIRRSGLSSSAFYEQVPSIICHEACAQAISSPERYRRPAIIATIRSPILAGHGDRLLSRYSIIRSYHYAYGSRKRKSRTADSLISSALMAPPASLPPHRAALRRYCARSAFASATRPMRAARRPTTRWPRRPQARRPRPSRISLQHRSRPLNF